MCIELLKAIVNKTLPLTMTDPHDIDELRILNAAGYLTALLPSPEGEQTFAKVLHITAEGRAAVTRQKRPAIQHHQIAQK